MLRASGFEVIDLGRDVPVEQVVKKAIELDVDIITGSALMTTTMTSQRDIIKALVEQGVRDKFKCMFGGAPVTQDWVDKIGADAYGENAAEAITKAKELVKMKA
jgi:trimethylamine corrinoid protein